jgi:hypothetical protein
VVIEKKPVGNITDVSGTINISPFGMCSSLANPAVAAATAAALGVLTPQPCLPQPISWTQSGTAIMIGGKPCLTQECQCQCSFGGTISVVDPGQKTVIAKG